MCFLVFRSVLGWSKVQNGTTDGLGRWKAQETFRALVPDLDHTLQVAPNYGLVRRLQQGGPFLQAFFLLPA